MKVLIALDHSDAAQEAARVAADLLVPMGADFLVLNVSQIPIVWAGAGGGFGTVAPLELATLDAQTSHQRKDVITEDAEAAGVPDPQVVVTSGDVVHEICEAAVRHDVDLIVVGTHDRSLLQRLLVPSVSRSVIREADRPVLVVPERAA
ncbi:universal stress protein [Iamia sp. SCSIO 61187]|uniref:universal stress protein n=1 Tax=Iamia sp. SCSIO 61187 TaxID=2722752 RepID=UPI001C62712E|nr:universal stress protein [Iamia sp. SCSIO 61187]QYG94057.1 universal stress protein [Iamia sp. SCSIO 61187]